MWPRSTHETITYFINVTNTGDMILYDVSIDDSLVGPDLYTIPVLMPGETVMLSYTYLVPPGSEPFDNVVTATGRYCVDRYVSDDDMWTVKRYSSVAGFKYADLSLDAHMDGGEPGLGSWVITLEGDLYEGGHVSMTRLTDSNGAYQFLMLKPGDYTVSEVMQSGWIHITAASSSFSLGMGQTYSLDFGNMPTGSISGYKWHDLNINGVWDINEPGIQDWTIYLMGEDVSGQTIDTWTMTDANGYYVFDGLLPGKYLVLEEIRLGWYATTMTQVEVGVTELVPFEIQGVNFGNAKYGMITGYKWEDEYMNGIWDGYELPVPGVIIGLEGTLANGDHFGPIYTTTNEVGFYAFYDLLPGEYTVWEILPDGWINILPSSYGVSIGEGSYVHCAKFANVRCGSIDGFKFLDWDMDGLFDGTEVGIPGWQITLTGWLNDGDYPWGPDGATHIGPITITTDANGYWKFPCLLPGVYTVTEEIRDMWYNTTASEHHIWLTSGRVVFDVKFGNVPYTCIWGHKFNDNNGNGVQDPGELGVPDWPIVIVGVQNDGTKVRIELLTDADGVYRTCYRILPGTYTIYEVMLQGWMPITQMEYEFEIPMSMEPMAYMFDFGNFKLGKIWGYKYEDVNGNGILDDGDRAIPGWDIYLLLPWGGVGVTSTDENGYYEFIGLPYGWYTVYEVLPDGWICTAAPAMPVLVLSDANIGLRPFLNYHYGCICGWKFEDLNSNGIWDDGEPPIPGWTIYMTKNGDPGLFLTTTNENGFFCFKNLMPDHYAVWEESRMGWTPTTVTGYDVWILSGDHIKLRPFGNFENVWIPIFKYEDVNGNGEYDDGDVPISGWHFTVSGPCFGVPVELVTDVNGNTGVWVTQAGSYLVKEEDREGWKHVNPASGEMTVGVVSGAVLATLEFGNFRCVDIIIFKYEDVDSSGDYDPQIDRPIEGWTFYIWDVWGQRYFELQTDANGEINLHICTYSKWLVNEEERDGWRLVTPVSGQYMFIVQSGLAINFATGQEQYVYEFGNFECVDILVFKYWDTCSNGWYDPQAGDVPIPNWMFGLFDEGLNLIDIYFTDQDGMITIHICKAGVYYVAEESREGWSWITPENGYYMVEIESGLEPIWLYFGNYEHVYVPIFKYEDMNSNGVYDDNDVPIPNWYFEMTRVGDPSTVYSGYTDANGMLVFTVDRSGIYLIDEEEREGWIHVNPSSGESLINVISGIVVPTQMFGNFHKAYITVCKVDDVNANGEFDPELDSMIEGWTFQLWIAVGMDGDEYVWELVETKVTGPCGCVSFEILKAGVYKVTEEAREGLIWISPADGETWEMWVHSGSDIGPIAFYNFKKGTIHGYKWNDIDGDGIWDEGEPGLQGWTIWFEGWLYPYGWMTGSTTTNETGYYEFTGLPPGDYIVSEVEQGGWIATTPPSVQVHIIGHSEETVNFGNFQLGCIDGYKFEDMNGNGIWDDGEPAIPGWTIYLAITTGVVGDPPMSAIMLLAEVTTDANGHYQFCGLGPGLYVVSEEQRAGWMPTSPTSETVMMTSGAHIRIHDFLNFELGWVCGWKFEDLNSNGIWDDGEPPIPDWGIELIKNGDPTGMMTWTDQDGFFCFTGLTADKYAVWEETRPGWTPTTQTGYVFYVVSGTFVTLPPFGNFENVWIPIFKYEDINGNGEFDNGDVPIPRWAFTVSGPCFDVPVELYTDENGMTGVWVTQAGSYLVKEEDREGWTHVNPPSGEMTVGVVSGMVIAPLEFGNFVSGQITGYKFYDWNKNGVQDDGEEGLSGWVIWIDGELVGGGTVHYTRITDTTGHYEVLGLAAGTYTVSERLELAPPGWVPTTPPSVEIDVISGTAKEVAFGNVVQGMIWGYKFYDKDMNGYRDELEPGLGGWLIILDGVTDKGAPVHMTTITDENGYYEFTDLLPGEYSITEQLEDGWYATVGLPIVVDVSGSMVYFEVRIDIGNIRFAKICGYKFLDTYEDQYPFWPNGAFDPDEYGLGNWKITLQGWTEGGEYISLVQFTDNEHDIGWYCFERLLPGTYWVNETLLKGYYATKPISNLVMVYPHPMGPVCIRIDFGNMIPSPDPEVNFVLKAGWNLWSAPMKVNGLTAKGLLDAIGPSGFMVVKLDKATGKYISWVSGDEANPSCVGNNFDIVLGSGYYVYANTPVNFKLVGVLASTTDSPLAAGWNMVGYNTLEPMYASELLSKATGTDAWLIVEYDSSAGKYVSYVKGDPAKFDFLVTPGRAYYVWANGLGAINF
jgi:protocatechuate 3,4-dioxygenase beta subunit